MTGSRLISAATLVAVTLLFAGLTHFLAVLMLPKVATRDAYDRLVQLGQTHGMTLLPASRPGDALIPFRDPATIQAYCLFDLAKAPMRIRTTVEEGRLLTLSFRTPEGQIFYSMTDRAAFHDKIDIRLVTEAQLNAVEDLDDEGQGLPEELRLKAPSLKGVIVATALVARPGMSEDARARVQRITCQPEPLPARS